MRVAFIGIIVTVFGIGCKEKGKDKLFQFQSPDQTGIHFVNQLSNRKLNIIQYMYYYNGGGVAAGDFNNDGLIDLYFTANEEQNKLYLNKGNFQFDDITEAAGVGGEGDWTTGVTLVDINNDGYLDIYVCQVGGYKGLEGHNLLYVNNGDLTFSERAAEYGLDFTGFSTQAVFFDYDNDGDLDMYLLNHSVHTIHSYGSSALRKEVDSVSGDKLYQNLSEQGVSKFKDVTTNSGIYSSHIGYGLGISVSDINQDGWMDIYIANDFHENDYLYINNGNGTFTESLEKLIAHTSRYSMGCDVADVNGDGLPDIVTLDMLPEDPEILLKSASEDTQEVADIKLGYGYGSQYVRNCLQINRGDHFAEVAQYAGVHATDWSWGALIADYINDGKAEIFITTGIFKRPNDLDYIQYTADLASLRYQVRDEDSVENEMIKRLPTLRIPNFMYQQGANLKFENRSQQWGLGMPSYSNGVTYADLDNDGDLELIINNVNQPAFIYENRSNVQLSNNYLKVELRSDKNYFGIGSRINVYADGKVFFREMILSRGFQSAVAPVAYFGLGNSSKIDSIEVFWRGNKFQVERNIKVNSSITITEARQLQIRNENKLKHNTAFLKRSPHSLPYQHKENDFKDYLIEPLVPYLLSREGPAIAVADVNGDGLDDIYLGGAKEQAGSLFIQNPDHSFRYSSREVFTQDFLYEDVDAEFADVNGDGFPDLYVVSAGNEYAEGHYLLEDRLYLNDGKGNFIRSDRLLPTLKLNGSCVRAADFNKDGHIDFFVGTRSVPHHYGISPVSYILKNDGRGNFAIHKALTAGMVTDAAWSDVDGDGAVDLVLVGDWMPISIYKNTENDFKFLSSVGLEKTEGWWRSVKVVDIDGDNQPEIIGGNAGENIRLKPTQSQPVTLLVNDFDNNGTSDPVMFFYQGSHNIPFSTKMQLGKQLPMINKKFNDYLSFSNIKDPHDLFEKEKLKNAEIKYSYTFKTSIFTQLNGRSYRNVPLHDFAQLSVVNDLLVDDFNGDGLTDVLCIGNTRSNTINLGDQLAQSAFLLLGGVSGYRPVPLAFPDGDPVFSSFNKAKSLSIGGKKYIVLTGSNQPVRLYSIEFNF